MPNGVSCAYFAVRNHLYGQKEENVFKEGIACAQTTRAASAAAESALLNNSVMSPFVKFLGKAAGFAKKIVYPLIIASGVYNTAVSQDKVKTGISQAAGITSMYTCEKAAEKGLNCLYKKLSDTNIVRNNKAAKAGLYVAKGMMFVAASLSGYNAGSRISEKIVDKARNNKNTSDNNISNSKKFPIEDDITANDIQATLFEDMIL